MNEFECPSCGFWGILEENTIVNNHRWLFVNPDFELEVYKEELGIVKSTYVCAECGFKLPVNSEKELEVYLSDNKNEG